MSKHTAEMFKNARNVTISDGNYCNVGGATYKVDGDVDPEKFKALRAAVTAAAAAGPDRTASVFEGYSGTLKGLNVNNRAGGVFTFKSSATTAKSRKQIGVATKPA